MFTNQLSAKDSFPSMGTALEDASLAWQWILEHLVDSKDVGTPIIREMMTYIPNLAYLGSLHRTALRYLEEAIAANRINGEVIPLITVLLRHSHLVSSFPTSSDYKTLLVRVKIEAVIVHIRGIEKDWHGLSKAIDQFFPEKAVDPNLLKPRSELLILLQDQGQEKRLKEVFDKYSLDALQRDLLKCVGAEKGRLGETFLEKLLQDVFNGTYPVCLASHKATSEKEESKENFLSANGPKDSAGSDDPTIAGSRNSNADLEETIESKAKKKLSLEHPQLRQRDQHGKAITSASPGKCMTEKAFQERISNYTEDKKTSLEKAGDSLHVEFLTRGRDGRETFCHNCQKGGRLLCCDGCPIAVHRKCLGYDAKSFMEKDWFCPLCAQRRAAEALARAKAEESTARKRALQFMESMNGRDNEKLCRNSSNFLEQGTGRKSADGGNSENLQGNNARNVPVTRLSSSSKEISKGVSASRKPSTSMDPSEACVDAHPLCKHGSLNMEQDGKNGKIMESSNKHPTGSEEIRMNDQGHTTIASSPKMDAIDQTDSPLEKLNTQGQIGEGDGHDGDLEEDSESTKPVSPKLKKDPRLYFRGNRIIPGLRRKRLQWTKEEEDALREGVKRFSRDNGSWGFQWTRILEFGQGKFHPSRSDVDLKDKWRNLCK